MADAAHHSMSSAKRFGGVAEDYMAIHQFFDASKLSWCDNRHRAILHHSFGIGIVIRVFGDELGMMTRSSDGHRLPVRWVAEQHVHEDCGFIPSIEDWLFTIETEVWMHKGARKLSKEFEHETSNPGRTDSPGPQAGQDSSRSPDEKVCP